MRSTEGCRGVWQLFCGVVLGLYLSAPAYAFTPSDSPLLSGAAVLPNVMLPDRRLGEHEQHHLGVGVQSGGQLWADRDLQFQHLLFKRSEPEHE